MTTRKLNWMQGLLNSTNDRKLLGKPAGYWLFVGMEGKQVDANSNTWHVTLRFEPRPRLPAVVLPSGTRRTLHVYDCCNLKKIAYIGKARRG
jgi:hypothetical protein